MNKRFLFRRSLENSLTILLIVAGVIILACFKVRPMDNSVAWCLAGVALLAIAVCLPDFLSRKDFLLFDSEGIHFSEKGRRTDLPWDQIRKCYFEMGPRGLRDYYPLYLAVKMKDGEKVLIRLNGRFRGTIKKWRAAIEQSCPSRKVFDEEKSTSEVSSQVFVLIIVVLLVFSFFLLFSSCQERGGAIMRGSEAVRDSSCIQFTNEAFIRHMHGEHTRIYHLSEAEMEEVDRIIAHRVTELFLMKEALPYSDYVRQMFALRKGGLIIVHVNLFAHIHWIEDLDDEAVMQGLLPPPPTMTKKDLQGKYGRFRRDYAETSWPVFEDGGYYYGNATVNLTRKNLRMLYFNGPHPF